MKEIIKYQDIEEFAGKIVAFTRKRPEKKGIKNNENENYALVGNYIWKWNTEDKELGYGIEFLLAHDETPGTNALVNSSLEKNQLFMCLADHDELLQIYKLIMHDKAKFNYLKKDDVLKVLRKSIDTSKLNGSFLNKVDLKENEATLTP